MNINLMIINEAVLIPLTVLITYHDFRYRRIPNAIVLGAFLSGIIINTVQRGWIGLFESSAGCALAISLMLVLRLFGGLGTGDVKLFGAIGALIGIQLVFSTFVIIVLIGGVLAVISALRAGTGRQTMLRVWHLFTQGLPPGGVPADHWRHIQVATVKQQTVPYGVAITFGSVISIATSVARG